MSRSRSYTLFGFTALVSGLIYSFVPGFQKIRLPLLPQIVEDWFSTSLRQKPTSNNSNSSRTAPRPAIPVSETNIQSLVAMGFNRDQARSALQRCNNNVEAACNLLLQ